MGSLTLHPVLPVSAWIALAAAMGCMLAFYARVRPGNMSRRMWSVTVGLMSVGLALVLAILLNPTWVRPLPPPMGKPRLSVFVDASASMATRDQRDGKSRYQAAIAVAEGLRAELQNTFETRLFRFAGADSLARLDVDSEGDPNGNATDIGAALLAGLKEEHAPGQAIVLLSDGIHNAGSQASQVVVALRRANALGSPVFTRTFGSDQEARDLSLTIASRDPISLMGHKIDISAVVHLAALEGRTVKVALRKGSAVMEEQKATFAQGADEARVSFQIGEDKPGLFAYTLEVQAAPGELSLLNNRAEVYLRVLDEPIRALLLEGKPYWDTKFLVRLLASDPSIDFTSVVQVAKNRFLMRQVHLDRSDADSQTRSDDWRLLSDSNGLLDREALRQFQIVVLGREADAFLTQTAVASLRDWIADDGGTLVCFRGAPASQISTDLAKVLPVKWSPAAEGRFRLTISEEDDQLRWLRSSIGGGTASGSETLPTLAMNAAAVADKPATVVWAETKESGSRSGSPVLSFLPYGLGRAVVLEGAGLWRWSFVPDGDGSAHSPYEGLCSNLLRWLVSNAPALPDQAVVRADKSMFDAAEEAGATVSARGLPPPNTPDVVLIGLDDGTKRSFLSTALPDGAGVYRVTFGKLPEGRYQAGVAQSTSVLADAFFEVRPSFREQLDLRARPEFMARIALETGGSPLADASVDEIAQRLRDHVRRAGPEVVIRAAAWDRWWIMLFVLSVWVTTWVVRRRSGLV